MPVDFYFNPHTYSIPSIAGLKAQWSNVPDSDILEVIAKEAQYLDFHNFLINSTKHTKAGFLSSKPYEYKLGLSVRAGAIKAALLLCASIAEAVLRAHAEKRKFKKLAKKPSSRTFGNVLNAWKPRGKPHKDIAQIWDDLDNLRDIRNNIHLFKAAYDPNATFKQVLKEEKTLLFKATKILDHLKGLTS